MASGRLGAAFWRFWGATFLANIGDGIRLAAFPLLAVTVTDAPLGVAMVGAAQFVPWLVAGLAAGSLADRRPARQLIAAADAARALVLVVLVVAVAADLATLWLVLLAALVLGLGETVRDTAAQTVVPRLVAKPALEKANSRVVAGEIVGNEFVGPPVGAALFVVGAAVPFAVNGGALALAVMLVLSVPLSFTGGARDGLAGAAGAGVSAGLRWLRGHPTLWTLTLVSGIVAAADSAWFAILVLYVRDALGLGAVSFGWLLACGAGGGLAGAAVASRLLGESRHRPVVAGAVVLTAVVPLLLVAVPELWAAVTVVAVTSGGFALFNVAALSLRHRLVPEGLLGRVSAAGRVVSLGSAGAGALVGGALATGLGLSAPFVLSGCLGLLALALWWTASRAAPGIA
jgi:predicted MFS family arabinose efflux permease